MTTTTNHVPFKWVECFNHHPAYPGIWVPYWPTHTHRYKEWYDIRLHDGSVHTAMYPNGMSWSGDTGNFKDEEVAEIRLRPASEHPVDFMRSPTQDYVIKHCIDLFGEETFPDVIPAGDGIAFIPKRFRWFDHEVLNSNGELTRAIDDGELTMDEYLEQHGNTTATQPAG